MPDAPYYRARNTPGTGSNQIAHVIPWPGGQPDKNSFYEEHEDQDEPATFLGKLDYSDAIPSVSVSTLRIGGMTPLPPRGGVSARVSLREEMPAAVRVYSDALEQLGGALPAIVATNKLELGIFEDCAAALVTSLERNRDALLCLSSHMRAAPYIFSHSLNVGIYLAAFSLECGKSRYEAITAGIAGLLHDVGMAMLPLSLLNSKKSLTATEQVLIKRHPQLTCDLLSATARVSNDIFFAALEHHESFDGSGYPSALCGAAISFMGQLTAIASAYDAISSTRPFQTPLHPHKALCRLFKERDTRFHPVLLENFVSMVGVFPVGSIVELQDGYLGIVCACNPQCPTRPVILLIKDPKGRNMVPLACDMANEPVAGVSRCLDPEEADLVSGQIFKYLVEHSL